jgi:hypothetical protein
VCVAELARATYEGAQGVVTIASGKSEGAGRYLERAFLDCRLLRSLS